MSERQSIETYREFWPYYLREHARPETRAMHFLGTGLSSTCLLALLVTRDPWFAPLALVAGYGPAWAAHYFLEGNKPATFSYPLWSLVSDYRMAWTWITGRLGKELANARVDPR